MNKLELSTPKFYPQPILLVDGIPRTGKSMLGPIMGAFESVEIERMEPIFEKVCQLYQFKKISKDAAISLLRLEIQMKLYESMISRNTNFRFSDHSGVFKQGNFLKYIKRLLSQEGDSVVEMIKKEQPIFQTVVHDLLGMNEIFFEAFGEGLRIIEMIRHPIDIIYSQYKRGHGKREGADPRYFSFTLKHKNELLPWLSYGWEDEYLAANPIDRLVKLYEVRAKKLWDGYEQLAPQQKNQVLIIPFERFIENPWFYINKIEPFIGKKAGSIMKKTLQRQRCPRLSEEESRSRKRKEIGMIASEKSVKILEDLSNNYEVTARENKF